VGVDQAGVIRFVNHQTESLFDYDRDDLIGQPVETLVPESLAAGPHGAPGGLSRETRGVVPWDSTWS